MTSKAVQEGDRITFTAGAAIASGDPVQIGEMVVAAAGAYANGDTKAVGIAVGVHEFPKVTANAFAQGDVVYFDGTNMTTTATSNVKAGTAWAAAANGDTTVLVKLSGQSEGATP